ncbi:MAG TPA: glycosyl hydrolase [Thermoanaerobaculia bacterium]|nr:glycosyl hydrolase [Thermoanaerobaculia bacterium]HQR67026.1 glycosyl hydrolase [Thermoanaerobaculia bacterium]
MRVRPRRVRSFSALLLPLLIAGPGLAAGGNGPEKKETALSKTEQLLKFHPAASPMPGSERLKGYGRRLEMEKASPLAAVRFRNVGPESQGGRIVDIAAPKNRPDTLLVAFASGGLFRTENRGGSWTPLFDDQSAMTIGAIAVGDPDGSVLWVGTGEANSSRTSYAGTGVFKSVDGGTTWRNAGLADSHHIGKIVVDARNPDTVLVAAVGPLYTAGGERGVFKTTDGGATWRRTLFVDGMTGAIDLVQDPARPGVLYAATWQRDRKAWDFLESGKGSGIWKSTDGGETWTRLSGGFPSGDVVGRIGLAVSPAKPDRIYAVLDNQTRRPESEAPDEEVPPGELTPRRLRGLSAEQFAKLDPAVVQRFLQANDFPKALKAKALLRDVKSGRTKLSDLLAYVKDANRDLFESQIEGAEVWRSDDGGATWKKPYEGRLEKVFYTYGYYFSQIFVAPDDADRVYFGGVPMLRSTDGGKSWKGIDRRGVHVDHHVLAFGPKDSRQVALGNDGGLNLSFDAGTTWVRVANLPVGQFTTVAVDDGDPYDIVGGLQDNGTMRGPSNYVPGVFDPNAWKSIGGGDGSMCQIDPKDRNVVYTAFQFGFAQRQNLKTGDRARVRPRPELTQPPLRYNWVTPFLISPHSREILWFGANRLFRSLDRGDDFTPVSADLTSNREQGNVPFGTATSVAESPKRFGVVWVGTDEGKVWLTRDGGASWKDVSKGLAKERWVSRVVASAFDEGTVYVTQNGYRNDEWNAYVWRSADYGETWTSLSKGLPPEPVNVIREDPKAKNLLYVGTDLGVFASLDRGETWMAMAGGLPHVPVHDLAVQPREGDVVLGTHGRSVFVAEAAPLRKLTEEVRKKDLHAFAVKNATWDRRRGYGDHPWLTWYRNPPVVRIAWWGSAAAAGPATLTLKDAYGNAWKEIAATSAAGMNVFEYDLSADRAKADAAEADVRRRREERAKAQEELEKKFGPPKAEAKAEGKPEAARPADGDDEEGGETAAGGAEKPLPPDLEALLSDPYRSKRTRYLPPGTYTVEIAAGGKTATTKLEVRKPKVEPSWSDDDD